VSPASSEVVSRDPWSGEVVFTCRAATEDAVAEAVERAVAAAERWSRVAVEERGSALARFADLLASGAVQMADLIVREVGKPRVEAESEVAWTATSARWYADHPPPEERAGGALVARRPLGVSAAVYSRDGERLASAGARLQAGVVALNRRGDDVELEAPFAGFRRSGNGFPEGGHWAYSAVTNLQAVYG
jgi:acyl-CoA reductase-like NAD-dependent aldehyde dehydrogenase